MPESSNHLNAFIARVRKEANNTSRLVKYDHPTEWQTRLYNAVRDGPLDDVENWASDVATFAYNVARASAHAEEVVVDDTKPAQPEVTD